MIRLKPSILHISCHGIENEQEIKKNKNIGLTRQEEISDQGKFLLFETSEAKGELISANQIRQLIKKSFRDLNVVILAACKSEYIGKVFIDAGAQHVICVKQNREMLDAAASKFSSTFYSNVFSGDQNICEAFEKAKRNVEMQHNSAEANLFTILTQDKHYDNKCQDCVPV